MADLPERVDAFANLDKFKPKATSRPTANNEDIEKISKDNGFPSREAHPPAAQKRPRFNSGESKRQLNIKVTESSFQRFYELAEKRGIRVLGDLFEQAITALEEKDSRESR